MKKEAKTKKKKLDGSRMSIKLIANDIVVTTIAVQTHD